MRISREFEINDEYICTVDTLRETEWNSIVTMFKDATINQTWAWASTMSKKTSNLVIKRKGSIVAAAMLRIITLPIANIGIAYIGAGPMWRLRDREDDIAILQHLIHALREEYVAYRGLFLRISLNIYDNYSEYDRIISVFEKENYHRKNLNAQTLFLNLNQSLEQIRKSFHSDWRYCLTKAEKNDMQAYQGNDEKSFITFRSIYKEMISRKKYDDPTNFDKYEQVYRALPDSLRPTIIICESEGVPAAGAIVSTVGETAIIWLIATGNKGIKCNAAYLVQWEVIKMLKQLDLSVYDLAGCSPEKNYDTYRFKYKMIGKEPIVYSQIGVMEACENPVSRIVFNLGMYTQNFLHLFKKLIHK
jgi:lipid II:glycine glycyltransferase (peptidoglycan interpeptide bridge formation enzyme)